MASSAKRKFDEIEERVVKKVKVSRPIPPPDPHELAIGSRKLLIALTIHPKRPVDNIWDALPSLIQNTCVTMAHEARVAEHRKLGFTKVLEDMMSFGICTCSNQPNCQEHHPRNVLINWRYKVRKRCCRFCFFFEKN